MCVTQNSWKMTFDFAFNSLNSIIQPVGAHRSLARSLAIDCSLRLAAILFGLIAVGSRKLGMTSRQGCDT